MFRTGKSGSVEFGTASKTRLASERSDSGCDANPTFAQPFSLSLRRCSAAIMNSFFRPRGSAVHQEFKTCFTMPLCSS